MYHRVNRGISHQELADKLGYKRAYGIVDLERGFNPIHYKDAVKLGEILNISPDELLNEHTRFCKPGYGICIAKITKYSLSPEVVDLIAFCTKNPAPMLSHMDVLKSFEFCKGCLLPFL